MKFENFAVNFNKHCGDTLHEQMLIEHIRIQRGRTF